MIQQTFHPGPALPGQLTLAFDAPSNGVETSDAAATSMQPHLAGLRALVLGWIESHGVVGAICDEAELALGLSHQCCSARFNDLMRSGHIVRTDAKRKTRTGRNAFVYLAKQHHHAKGTP